jgi:hypothetical protein
MHAQSWLRRRLNPVIEDQLNKSKEKRQSGYGKISVDARGVINEEAAT